MGATKGQRAALGALTLTLVSSAAMAGAVGQTTGSRPEHVVAQTVQTPWIDLSRRTELQTIVDREPGRLETPNNFEDDHNAPTIHRITDPAGTHERLVMFVSYPVMKSAVSEDGGKTWSDLQVVGDWSAFPGAKPCEPAIVRSPDGKQLLCLLRENARKHNSLAMTSEDEGRTWTPMFELPAALTGDRHIGAYLPDGRLLITFRDMHAASPNRGDFVAWVGTYADIVDGREGQFTCRLLDNMGGPGDTGYAGLEVLPDGTIVSTSYCRLKADEEPVVVSVRYTLAQMQELVPTRGYDIPLVDLDADEGRHVIVDREQGQYLGHVTTALLEDGKTIHAVYPKGHGRGPIVYKRSGDGGLTWSERLPTPDTWATSREVPTIHAMVDPRTGEKRLIMWSGLYPARRAVSPDDGAMWSELEPVGDWGGIVVMGFVERLADGSYFAMFHDDGRFFTGENKRVKPPVFTLYQTFSHDGGLTWTHPDVAWSGTDLHLCEPGCIRSPDGKMLAVLLRENSRKRNSHIIFSSDEAGTWSAPRELPASLTGDRHTLAYAPDGRLFITFRDTTRESSTQGDWVAWVGTWEDLLHGRPGQYRVRIKDNKHRWDTTYPGLVLLPDGTFVVTTYGHWDGGEEPYILSARFTLDELDARAASLPGTDGDSND